MSSLIVELQRRSVYQVGAVYAAVSFIVLQVADLTFAALQLSESVYRALVWAVLLGFPVALVLAWFFDLTSTGVKLTARVPALPAGLSPKRRFELLSLMVVALLAAFAGGVSVVRGRMVEPRSADGRIAVAVFPFRTVGVEGSEWSEGISDLLATALDGTEGLWVHDPWSLWRPLRAAPGEAPVSPDPVRASELARQAGARRVVLGSVVGSGERVDVAVRIYDPRAVRPLATFGLTGSRERMPALVDQLVLEVITRIWDRSVLPGMTPLEPKVTSSPDALKAYLAAKVAMRRGHVDSAAAAIDRAISVDSTFALALVEAVTIHSWRLSMTGQPYAGFFELLGRAQAHASSLTPRLRLRLEASLASVQTRGAAAAEAASGILEQDSTDLAAWALLAYVQGTYGWQYGATAEDALASTNRVLRLDSSYVPSVVHHAWLTLGDEAEMRLAEARLARIDTSLPLARGALRALRALAAPEDSFGLHAEAIAGAALPDWIAAIRNLRVVEPARAELLLARLATRAQPGLQAYTVAGEQLRLLVAQGRTSAVDSALSAGAYPEPGVYWAAQRLLLASGLAGLATPEVLARSAQALERYVPPDSALAYWQTRPVWWVTWLVGAYHAELGDTARAGLAGRTIGTFPPGGSPAEYRAALQADIAARLAVRRGDLPGALGQARRAYELWSIHTENQVESVAEPALRFHLAMLLAASGDTAAARPLLVSLQPPISWFGFYTARAAFESGQLALAAGDTTAARRHYQTALRLWSRGGPEIAQWRGRAEVQLARLAGRLPG